MRFIPASGHLVAVATLQFERSDFALRGHDEPGLFRRSVDAAHLAAMDHHVGDGHRNGEHLHLLDNHLLARIGADGFDHFAIIFFFEFFEFFLGNNNFENMNQKSNQNGSCVGLPVPIKRTS